MIWNWNRTNEKLPPESQDVFLLGEGDKVSGNAEGRYSIMQYDGNWWNEDGLELSEAPEWWTFISPPNAPDQVRLQPSPEPVAVVLPESLQILRYHLKSAINDLDKFDGYNESGRRYIVENVDRTISAAFKRLNYFKATCAEHKPDPEFDPCKLPMDVKPNAQVEPTSLLHRGSDALFGMLKPFPAPLDIDLLFWNGAGWFLGQYDGTQFREQGSGWVSDIDDKCGFIDLPNVNNDASAVSR